MNFFRKSSCILLAFVIGLGLAACAQNSADHSDQQKSRIDTSATQKNQAKTSSTQANSASHASVNWNAPSGGTYPVLKKGENIWLDVSIKQQKVYIKTGNRTLYTMIVSTGLGTDPDNATPTGTYYIQAERGQWFYTPQYNEGAKYWVSWKNHGEFLFHSVPMDKNQHVLTADAEKLGQKDSHGCIHLTVPDAKWVYEHVPFNTKVVIQA
ncbi:L,D-transpeptidase [Sporolactobacillus sp. CQH2019]|uniref:L,D-transpeptidase n=1 Tax=Sporolactobacillus sp. CQH2019 TaxID=3023512 RepID=UPI002368B63F|nr:L,D-transpeptidase [Sporolactobacillus sp. CQH2019]MDD9148322.1 L,D-transpeptidase [Sporolactobacillus sp. CQH2019]